MKVTIEINDKLFKKDVLNKFQDCLENVILEIADTLDAEILTVCSNHELETLIMLKQAFSNAEYEAESEV